MTKRRLRALNALLVFVSGLFVVGQSTADDTGLLAKNNFSGTATITSDYVFRGLSQTKEDPAVQASFDYKHPSGVFLGAWASNVDETISEGNVEIDLYGGYRGQLFENLSYELSIIYYWYPGGGMILTGIMWSFTGVSIMLLRICPWNPTSAWGSITRPISMARMGMAIFTAELSASLCRTVLVSGLSLVIRMSRATRPTGNGRGLNGRDGYDYLFWKIGLSKEVLGFNLDVSYYDTNEEEYFGQIGDSRFVFSISRSF